MPQSGDVAVSGVMAEGDPTSLIVFSSKEGKLNRKKISSSCGHKCIAYLSSLIINGREQLAVSCNGCDELKLLDLQTGEWSTAFTGCKPRAICSGGRGRIFLEPRGEKTIQELDCTRPVFKGPIRTVHTNKKCRVMCYIPPPIDALVLSDVHSSNMVMKSVKRDKIIWMFKNEKEGTYNNRKNEIVFDREGLLFHSEYKVLLVADGDRKRVLIVDPGSGRLIQNIDLSHMGRIKSLCLYNDRLVMLHETFAKYKISYLNLLK